MSQRLVRDVIAARLAKTINHGECRTACVRLAYLLGRGSANPTIGGGMAPFNGFSGTRTVKGRRNGEDD